MEEGRVCQSEGISIEASVTEGAGERVAMTWAMSRGLGSLVFFTSEGMGREKIPRLSSGHCVRR